MFRNTHVLSAVVVGVALVVSAVLVSGPRAVAHPGGGCAFIDVNHNGVLDGADTPVDDSVWVGGAAYVAPDEFVVPLSCDHVFSKAPPPLFGVSVTAPKITFAAQLITLSPGGKGVKLVATGPGGIVIDKAKIHAGGVDKAYAANGRSVMLVAEQGPCKITDSDLAGISPLQGTNVGVKCKQDVTIRNSTITAALVHIQSTDGMVDGSAGVSSSGACADPGGSNLFTALNWPLIVIAAKDVVLDGSTLIGRYRVTLASITGNISTKNANVTNDSDPFGGAFISLFPHPASVDLSIPDREDFFGPSTGSTNITQACYTSPQSIRYGASSTVPGVPDAAPCAQFPAAFTSVLNGNY